MAVSSYQKLKDKLKECETKLYLARVDLVDAHLECDKLDVPKHDVACLGHRLFWYRNGQRESFKTKENTEGYPPEVHEAMIRKLEEVRTPPAQVAEKKTYQDKLNIVRDVDA